ncbi:MAG: hypothetical protein KF866_05820 [Phycisphaeraceae bacterium]|nr:hypothetical protein [Phycisphaeraceae bacterium]MCW5754512.1 hypothetical protein [Phycisphaeraceae bacterium]
MMRTGLVAAAACVAPMFADVVVSPVLVAAHQPDDGWTMLSVDRLRAAELNARHVAIVQGFPLDRDTSVTLVLRRADVFAPHAQVVATTAQGVVDLGVPLDPVFVGRVLGHDDSLVTLTLTEDLVAGLIEFEGQMWVLSTGPAGEDLTPVIAPLHALPAELRTGFTCTMEEIAENIEQQRLTPPGGIPETENPAYPCRIIDIAYETDRELLVNRFGGSTANATAYIQLLTAALTEIYTRDVNLRFRISYLSLWTTNDPWNQNSTSAQLNQFRSWWAQNRTDVERDVAHFLSGRNLGGGVAYLSAVCNGNAYGLSANLAGFFPYPLVDHHGQNWDIMVTAHELGHNLGSGHTHDIGSYDPVIDGCGNGDCSDAWEGTIMSYCHTCPGGMTNINLRNHPRVNHQINFVLRTISACSLAYDDSPVIVTPPQNTTACYGGPASLSVVALGENMRFSWRQNGMLVQGANTPTLTFDPFEPHHAGVYQVRIDTDCGGTLSGFVTLLPEITVDCNNNGICDEIDIARGDSFDLNGNGIPDECECKADLSGSADPLNPAYGVPDGLLDTSDFFYFLDQFAAGNLAVADMTGSADPADSAYGQPDGVLDAADFFYYLDLFVSGCN